MAKAEKKTIKKAIERVVVDYETHDVIFLELTEDEAKALVAVLYRVGGQPEGARGLIQNVSDTLCDIVGPPPVNADRYWDSSSRKRGLYFEDDITREQFIKLYARTQR